MGIKSQSNGGDTLESTIEGVTELANRMNDGTAYSGFKRLKSDGFEDAMVGFFRCEDNGQPLSQDELASEVIRTNQELQDFGADWAEHLEIKEADLGDVTRQCIAENYPAARDGIER
ncbi:MAG: hypothetical protein WA790_02890 [Sulfitobacter sp.]